MSPAPRVELSVLPPAAFARHDESPDDVFYSFPRKVVHIDDDAIAALSRLYAEEMADNPQLTRFVVHDLNRDPRLPFLPQTFDGVVCAVSIQYVIHPVPVFQEVRRVLRPGAPFVLSFSNRCFPTKAVAVWLSSS